MEKVFFIYFLLWSAVRVLFLQNRIFLYFIFAAVVRRAFFTEQNFLFFIFHPHWIYHWIFKSNRARHTLC